MKKTLSLMVIVVTFIISCKKETNNKNNTGSTSQQAKLIYLSTNVASANNGTGAPVLMSVNYDGTGAAKLFTFPNDQYTNGPGVMSQDHKTLFLSGAVSSSLYAFTIAGGTTLNAVVNTNEDSFSLGIIGTTPATATQQSQFVYSAFYTGNDPSANTHFELHTANLDGASDKKVNVNLPANKAYTNASLFQDGKTLLINLEDVTDGNIHSLATCNIDGTNFKIVGQIDLSQDGLYPIAVAGTASQGVIFYSKTITVDNAGNFYDEIWVSNTDLSGLKKLTITLPSSDLYIGDVNGFVSVSPDGKTLFFPVASHNSAVFDNRGIYSCNVDGTNVHAVVPVDLSGVNDYVPLAAY